MLNYRRLKIDLTNCDKEPINIIGRIQPHGFLFIVDPESFVIEQASSNSFKYLQLNGEEILGQNLSTLIQSDFNLLKREFLKEKGEVLSPQIVEINHNKFFAFIEKSSNKIIFECEPYISINTDESLQYNLMFGKLNEKLNVTISISDISKIIVDFFHKILDYDRVIIFRFDVDWNAEVVAEKIKPNIDSFEGHHFPASDIPAPARVLLEQKHIRHIPEVGVPSVEIVPYINPSTNSPTDILLSVLRNPSELHTEYLQNMDVKSSLSFSLIVKGKLWGLISCTHYTPVFIEYWRRELCDRAAKTFSHIIPSIEEKRDSQNFLHLKEVANILINQVIKSRDIKQGLFNQNLNLLELTQAGGAALSLNNKITRLGDTPEEHEIALIIDWLSEYNENPVYSTRMLSKDYPKGIECKEYASGLLALEISKFSKEYLLFFKPEIKETKTWAGNPDKPKLSNDQKIHPRRSFEQWIEVISSKSQPWSKNEIEVSQLLLKDVIAIKLKQQAEKVEQLYNQLKEASEDLKLKNSKLEEFSSIITHNLRAPMVTISSLYAYYMQDPTPEKSEFVMEKMKVVSDNMLSTINDLNLILQVKIDHQLKSENNSFKEVIDKELQNLQSTIIESEAVVAIDLREPTINIPKIYLESIIHNLVSNALKYTSPRRKPAIKINTWKNENEKIILSVSDNGLGIDMDKFGNKIFGLYKTFHRNKDSKGLGLYLTKMQIESLGGRISVVSELDKGTTFLVEI